MFENLLNRIARVLLSLIVLLAICLALVLSGIGPSRALVTDPNKNIPARTCEQSQNTCYFRVTVNFNDPRIASGVWFGTIPANSFITAIDAYVTTAFNAGTTNAVTVGTTAASANEVVASGITVATPGIYHLTSAAGLGTPVTANVANQTALNGNVPLFVKYAQTGTAATTGAVTIVIQFAKNDDQ